MISYNCICWSNSSLHLALKTLRCCNNYYKNHNIIVNQITFNWFPFKCSYSRLTPREFNSYGARRGNDAVMTRGTFANIKLLNKFIGKPAPKTVHFPSGQTVKMCLFTEWLWTCAAGLQLTHTVSLAYSTARRVWSSGALPERRHPCNYSSRKEVWTG